MKFLIAGLGSIGRRHLRNLVSLGERDILLYRTHKSTLPNEALAPYPVELDLAAALGHQPDAVIVSNPTALHMSVALPAARAGCHLFLEKPIAAEVDKHIRTLQNITSEKELNVLVGFQFRFHPVLNTIKIRLDSGSLGRVFSFRVHWGEYLPGWHPWEDYHQSYAARKDLGGGVVNTLSHPLDYVRWLFGEVVSISAVTGQVSDLSLAVEDCAEITLTMNGGCIGSIHLDYFQRPPAHWLEIICENAYIHWDNESASAKIFHVKEQSWERIEPPPGFERNDLFVEEMRHFLRLIKGETAPRCSLADGIRALELTMAVHASAENGCVISL